jgi:hypothetical protein
MKIVNETGNSSDTRLITDDGKDVTEEMGITSITQKTQPGDTVEVVIRCLVRSSTIDLGSPK